MILALVATPKPFPVDIVHNGPDSGWVIASACAGIAVAIVTAILAGATVALAKQTKNMAVETASLAKETKRLAAETKASLQHADRAEQLKFTDQAIMHMVEPQMQDALNHILRGRGSEDDQKIAREMFSSDLRVPMQERSEPQKSYFKAVGLYDNLFDRISSYSEAGLIDEHLFFEQYDELVIQLYFLLCDYVWEGNEFSPRTRITKFATRAFLHYAKYAEIPWTGDDQLAFYEKTAREFYPGEETEALLARARQARNQVFLQAYSRPAKPQPSPLPNHSDLT